MFDWFGAFAAGSELPIDAASDLHERGFVVLPGPVPSEQMARLVDAYRLPVVGDRRRHRVGSTSTNVIDFIYRGAEFDELVCVSALWRRAAGSSAGRSSSVRCTRERCGQHRRRRNSTSTFGEIRLIGRCSGLSYDRRVSAR